MNHWDWMGEEDPHAFWRGVLVTAVVFLAMFAAVASIAIFLAHWH